MSHAISAYIYLMLSKRNAVKRNQKYLEEIESFFFKFDQMTPRVVVLISYFWVFFFRLQYLSVDTTQTPVEDLAKSPAVADSTDRKD